ncbi:hypothetical protein [Streptomyces sp. NPDC056921]|uniref:hypothetical protein n=1 Tax=Streptomyces sp. NPDC056921 TaxID=3345966 RepID=UPI0036348D88
MCTSEQIVGICKETVRFYGEFSVLATLVATEPVLAKPPRTPTGPLHRTDRRKDMPSPDHDKYRLPAEERWTDDMRTEPVQITVRTEWLYSEYNPKTLLPEGRTRHPFSRSGRVTASDVAGVYAHMQDLAAHLHRAVAAFGDDRDLVIEVRLAGDGTAVPENAERSARPGPEIVPSEPGSCPPATGSPCGSISSTSN